MAEARVSLQDDPEINRQLRKVVRRSRRVIWAIITVMGVLLMVVSVTAAVLVQRSVTERTRVSHQVATQAAGLCTLLYDTAISVPPYKVLAVSKATVKFRIDVRTAVANLGCPERLPPPPPQLVQAAAHYHLKIPY